MRDTPLTVGSPQQVIDRYGKFRDQVGHYQRQMFLMDHAGLPLKTVLEQIDILATEVVPVLRAEAESARPAHVPANPPIARRAGGRGRRPRVPCTSRSSPRTPSPASGPKTRCSS